VELAGSKRRWVVEAAAFGLPLPPAGAFAVAALARACLQCHSSHSSTIAAMVTIAR
jgi:hypothetical protein